MAEDHPTSGHTSHSYFEWQLSTLMFAYDAVEPLRRDDDEGIAKREVAAREELYKMAHSVLPREYIENPQSDFPPEIVQMLTYATLRRAMAIVEEIAPEHMRGVAAVPGE